MPRNDLGRNRVGTRSLVRLHMVIESFFSMASGRPRKTSVSLMRGVELRSSAKAAGPRIANATTGITLLCFSFLWTQTRRSGSTLGCILSSTYVTASRGEAKRRAPASQIRSRWLIKYLYLGSPDFYTRPVLYCSPETADQCATVWM